MSLDFFLNRAIYVLKLLVDSYKIAYIFIEPIKVPLSGVTKLTILCFLMVSYLRIAKPIFKIFLKILVPLVPTFQKDLEIETIL